MNNVASWSEAGKIVGSGDRLKTAAIKVGIFDQGSVKCCAVAATVKTIVEQACNWLNRLARLAAKPILHLEN